MIQAVYALWLARNEARDGKRIEEPHEIMKRVMRLVEEWQQVHEKQTTERHPIVRARWEAPDEGCVKVTADGAFSKSRG